MEQNLSAEERISEKTIYRDKAMWVGAAIGGPLATGYLAAENYKVFGEKDKVWKTWAVAVVATLFVFSLTFYAPYADRVPGPLFALVQTGMAYLAVRIWQGAKIDAHVRAGGRVYGWYRVIGISLIWMLATLIPFATFAYFNGDFTETTKTYGALKHEITFNKGNVSEAEIDKIADAFARRDFFGTDAQTFVYVEKIKNTYEISISCSGAVKTNPTAIPFFTALRQEIQSFFPENKIVFLLIVDRLDNVYKRLE
jgi:hypothetical protein